uniref:Uncharacterized protein n=2 Tax=Lygus hesperus TaxID=30085 RepID=A0A146L6U3_LYGHE
MLIQGALLVIISKTVLPGPIPQELIAISNIRENVRNLTKHLDDFRSKITAQITLLENSFWTNRKDDEPPRKHMNETICLQREIPQARMEVNKLLNMLVEGEKNQLITLESSLIDMKAPAAESDVQQLNQLWGSLASHGESRRKIQSEMANFEVKTKDRYEIVRKSCITGNSTTIVLSS